MLDVWRSVRIIGLGAWVSCSSTPATTDAEIHADANAGSDGDTTPGRVISSSMLSTCEGETDLAATDDGRVLVAWIDGAGESIGYRMSSDRGQSWMPVRKIDSLDGKRATDPVVAHSRTGELYLAWLGFRSGYRDEAMYLAHAASGAALDPPVIVSDPSEPSTTQYDRPGIAVTDSGAVVITYAIVRASDAGLVAAVTQDGQTFIRTPVVQTPTFQIDDPYPCYSEALHRLFVAYYQDDGTPTEGNARIGLRWSDDLGATWPGQNATTVASASGAVRPAQDGPACIATGSNVWVLYGMTSEIVFGTNPKLSAIRVAVSSDGGHSFNVPIDAGDPAAGTFFLHPALAREDDGTLDLVYYAGNADGDPNGSFRWARWPSGAPTFGRSQAIWAPLTFLQSHTDPRWLGDYVGLRWNGGRIFTSYTDNGDRCSHVAFFSGMP